MRQATLGLLSRAEQGLVSIRCPDVQALPFGCPHCAATVVHRPRLQRPRLRYDHGLASVTFESANRNTLARPHFPTLHLTLSQLMKLASGRKDMP
jgi:hypothetical protein